MPDWMPTDTALRYFGLQTEAELEDLVLEFNIDAEVDNLGNVLTIDASDTREALFESHKRKVGHRPDDPQFASLVQASQEHKEQDEKQVRDQRRQKLVEKKAKR